MTTTIARNATLNDLADLLTKQQARKVDMVVSNDQISYSEGQLLVNGVAPMLEDSGVTEVNGVYVPTEVFEEGISDKLGIPLPYLRRMRAEKVGLLDRNVNAWLEGERNYLLRCFKPDTPGTPGIARAFLSDRFKTIDNLDVLTAILQGVKNVGTHVEVVGCDLSDRRMSIRFKAPEVTAYAHQLVKNYRSPFSGRMGMDNPTVFAGLAAGNSETGNGAFTIVPRMILKVCDNGATITKDAMREVHLGGKLEEGVIDWSTETQERAVELIISKTQDAVRTFLDAGYMTRVIADLEAKSGTELTGKHKDGAAGALGVICKRLAFSQEAAAGILDMFIKGADTTAGGVMQAVTAYAQTVDDPDKANAIEEVGVRALELAAAL